ncbi:MAG: hypothetical protein PWQ93_365 [Clostridiales bacterium]|jgi:Zn-dependent peptidase ImmA (M78 family)|nr:hypothetical protein [Clostridiales bacterium]
MKIKLLVECLIKKYNTRNPFDLAKCLHIYTEAYNFTSNIKGMYYREDALKIIGYSLQLPYEESKVVLAHELGHALLHKDLNFFFLTDTTNFHIGKFEREANEFAAELLIPDDDLTELIKENNPTYYLSVPEDFITLKIKHGFPLATKELNTYSDISMLTNIYNNIID